jgi:hypothetical protein
MLIIIDNTYFFVSLPAFAVFVPGDALLHLSADEVGLRPIFDGLNRTVNKQQANSLVIYFYIYIYKDV